MKRDGDEAGDRSVGQAEAKGGGANERVGRASADGAVRVVGSGIRDGGVLGSAAGPNPAHPRAHTCFAYTRFGSTTTLQRQALGGYWR